MPAAKVVETTTYKINAVEVFSTGEWNGTRVTTKDLDDMVSAYEELKGGIRPYLKFGHANEQMLAQKTGLPSIGWVTNLYRQNNKLLADFDYIPSKVFSLLQSRAYRKVSCEVYFDINISGKKYRRVLGAVALLGAETPGVMNLDDILGQYSFQKRFAEIENLGNAEFYSFENQYILTGDGMPEAQKTDAELALEAATAAAETQKKEFELQLSAKDAELEALRQFKAEAEIAAQTAFAEAEAARKEAFCAKLEAKKIVTPGMKDMVLELLGESKQEYSIADKKMSREELLESLLSLSHEAGKVNFTESSTNDFAKDGDLVKETEKEIQSYQDSHKCDYATAHKAVLRAKGKGE